MMETKDNTYWFKPKRHGYGATPTHWKGWLVTTAFAVGLAMTSILVLQAFSVNRDSALLVVWVIAVIAATYGFCRYAKSKTEGPWGWRWNGKLYRDMFEPGSDGASSDNRRD